MSSKRKWIMSMFNQCVLNSFIFLHLLLLLRLWSLFALCVHKQINWTNNSLVWHRACLCTLKEKSRMVFPDKRYCEQSYFESIFPIFLREYGFNEHKHERNKIVIRNRFNLFLWDIFTSSNHESKNRGNRRNEK